MISYRVRNRTVVQTLGPFLVNNWGGYRKPEEAVCGMFRMCSHFWFVGGGT